MNNLDEELRRALRREEPPAGFAERVLERLPAATSNVVPISARGRIAPRFAFAAAAALAVATAGVWYAIPRGDMHPTAPSVVTGTDSTNTQSDGPQSTMLLGVELPEPPKPQPKAAPAPRLRVRPAPRPSTEDAEAVRAAEQLRIALHITGDALNVARRELRESALVPTS